MLEFYFQLLGYDIKISDTHIAEALKLLPEKKRMVVLMSYYLNMSVAEIAEYLNLKQSTIYYHRKSSLNLIKEYIEENKLQN